MVVRSYILVGSHHAVYQIYCGLHLFLGNFGFVGKMLVLLYNNVLCLDLCVYNWSPFQICFVCYDASALGNIDLQYVTYAMASLGWRDTLRVLLLLIDSV